MFAVLWLLAGAGCVQGQVTVTMSENVQAAIPAREQQDVQDAVAPLIRQYERLLGGIIDVEKQTFDRDKARQFEKLFSLDAKVINDLREEPEEYPIGIIAYLELVEDYFIQTGVLFSITSAEIADVSYVSSSSYSYYNVDVRVGKSVQNFFTSKGTVERGERGYDLKFNIILRQGEPETARISTINLPGGVFAADYTSYFAFGAAVGLGRTAFGGSPVLSNPTTSGSFELDGGLHLGADLFYMSNFFAPKSVASKRLYLLGRLGVMNTRLTGALTDYSSSTSIAVTGRTAEEEVFNSAERRVSGLQASDENALTRVYAGIGLSYRVHAGKKSSFFVSAEYAPSYLISGAGSVSGSGSYGIAIQESLPPMVRS